MQSAVPSTVNFVSAVMLYVFSAVAVFIVYSGIILAKETVSPLLGEGINEELKEILEDYI